MSMKKSQLGIKNMYFSSTKLGHHLYGKYIPFEIMLLDVVVVEKSLK
jgi:hypothetical protein